MRIPGLREGASSPGELMVSVAHLRAGPSGYGPGLGMTNGLGYDRPRPAMPPPGFGLQF